MRCSLSLLRTCRVCAGAPPIDVRSRTPHEVFFHPIPMCGTVQPEQNVIRTFETSLEHKWPLVAGTGPNETRA